MINGIEAQASIEAVNEFDEQLFALDFHFNQPSSIHYINGNKFAR